MSVGSAGKLTGEFIKTCIDFTTDIIHKEDFGVRSRKSECVVKPDTAQLVSSQIKPKRANPLLVQHTGGVLESEPITLLY